MTVRAAGLVLVAALSAACGRIAFTSADGSATGDGSGDSVAAATCPPGVLLCELGDAAIDTALWSEVVGTITLDSTIVHRGASSLKMSMPAAQSSVALGVYLGHSDLRFQVATL